jgi:hypothetical protein
LARVGSVAMVARTWPTSCARVNPADLATEPGRVPGFFVCVCLFVAHSLFIRLK